MANQNIIYIESESEAEKYDTEHDAEIDPWTHITRLEPDLRKLYRAAMDGKWETAKDIINADNNAKTAKISPLGFTALHVAASCGRSEFVEELVKHLRKKELEIRDQVGRTALHHVALAASVGAAKAMVEKNPDLPQLGDMNDHTPLLYAAQWRHRSKGKEMLEYLRQVTKDEPPCHAFTGDSASNLIVAISASRYYDIALSILERYPELACSRNDEGMSILHALAMRHSAFRRTYKLSLWNLLTYKWMRKRSEIKLRHSNAVRLAEHVCEELQKKSISFIEEFFIPKEHAAILHLAIEHGVLELVQICLKHFPDLIWYSNYKERLLLQAAIEHRQVGIFNYMIDLIRENTKAYAELVDQNDDNSLHMAAKLAPSPQLQSVPGPAFQMLREIQWFKAVKALVHYMSRTRKNQKEKTPRELFIDEHKELQKQAKAWMKDMSNSCMVVAALVATVAFAAIITVPGGNVSGTGIPILSKKKLFIPFTISNALSMISSAISLLMFLALQTSRYTDKDFLGSLPTILLGGLIFLFIAVATMMISFGTAIGLSLQTRIFNWAYIPITVVACCPAIIFYNLQLPLLYETLKLSTSGPGRLKRQRDSKFRSLNKIG